MALARAFDGVDDMVTGTITAMDAGDWTVMAWINAASAGEGGTASIIRTETAGAVRIQNLRFNATLRLIVEQRHATTVAVSTSAVASAVVAGTWTLCAATYRASDSTGRIYTGTAASAMAEVAYSGQIAGAGARTTAGVNAHIGNNSSAGVTFDGSIGPGLLIPSELTTTQMDAFRLGLTVPASCAWAWWMDNRDAAIVNDYSGNGVSATVTGAVLADGPPVGWQPYYDEHEDAA